MSNSPSPAMLHRCSHHSFVPVGTRVQRAPCRTVDVHCHLLTPAVEALLAPHPTWQASKAEEAAALGEASRQTNEAQIALLRPRLTSVETRLADMDAMGVDVQLVSPAPTQYHYWAEPDLARQVVDLQNDNLSALCAAHPDRFRALGMVAMQDPKLAARQLEGLMRDRGFKGVEVSSLVNGRDLADRFFDPFWEAANRLQAVVFIHPWGTTLGTRLAEHYLMNTIGQPLETTICLSKLLYGGTLDRHPQLRIIAAHGGGFLPMYSGRTEHAYAARPEVGKDASPPCESLRRLWFDSVVHDTAQLRQLIERVGADRVLLGTDYPFDMGHYDPAGLVAALPVEQQRMLLGENAAGLLQL